jgi:arginase family enzyme
MGLDAPVSNLQDVDLRLLRVFTSVVRNGGFTAAQNNVKMKRLVSANADVILSVDVDGLDPSLVPGVILPAFGGLSYQ